MFKIVEFTVKNDIAVVPNEWIHGTSCYWPPYISRKRIEEAAEAREPPKKWKLWDVIILESFGMKLLLYCYTILINPKIYVHNLNFSDVSTCGSPS